MGGNASQPVPGIADYAARGKGFFMMLRSKNTGRSSIFVYGVPADHPILRTIFSVVKKICPDTEMSNQPDKHGEFVTKFSLGGRYFHKGQSFETAGKIKIMFNEMIEQLIGKHGYRPAFSTDLSRYNDKCTIYWENMR